MELVSEGFGANGQALEIARIRDILQAQAAFASLDVVDDSAYGKIGNAAQYDDQQTCRKGSNEYHVGGGGMGCFKDFPGVTDAQTALQPYHVPLPAVPTSGFKVGSSTPVSQGLDQDTLNVQLPKRRANKSHAGRAGGTGTGSQIQSPKQLMRYIATAGNLRVLHAVVKRHLGNSAWDALCSGMALKRVGQLGRESEEHVQTLLYMLTTKLTQQLQSQVMSAGAGAGGNQGKPSCLLQDRAIADIMWALARVKYNHRPLLELLVHCYVESSGDPADTSASRLIWSAGTLGLRDPQLLQCALAKAQAHLMLFNEVELSQMCVGLARLRSRCTPFLQAVAARSVELMAGFNAQNIANVTWAFTSLGVRNCELLAAAADRAIAIIDDFTAKALAITAWSFAALGFLCQRLMQSICKVACTKVASFNSQDIATLAWSCASLSLKDRRLLWVMGRRLLVVLPTSNNQDLSIAVWAYAVLDMMDEQLYEAAANRATVLMPNFKPQDVANLVWGLAAMNVYVPELMEAAARRSCDIMSQFSPQELGNVLWAFGKLGCRHHALMTTAVDHVVANTPTFLAQDLMKVVSSLAMMGVDFAALQSQSLQLE